MAAGLRLTDAKGKNSMLRLPKVHLAVGLAVSLTVPMHLLGQNVPAPAAKSGTIVGTATDVNGDPVPDAAVELRSSDGKIGRAHV